MSWNLQFVGLLNRSSLFVRYRLEFIGVFNSLGEPFDISDKAGSIQIARGSVRIQGSRVIPQRWSVTFGGFSLTLTGDIRFILPKMRRGQIAVLQCSINRGEFTNLAIGALDTISGQRGKFVLRFKDLLSALQTSLDTQAGTAFDPDDPPHFSMFYKVGKTTTSTGADFGTSDTDTTLNVTDASFFQKAGSKGIAKCINDGPGGNNQEFYLFWTGKTSTSLTGITTAIYNNTARITLKTGSTIKYCAWLQGEPYEILASILTSTGTGNNGEFDVYPQEWSIGGQIDKKIFDLSDARRASKEITRSDGSSYNLGFAVEEPLLNGLRSIVDIFLTVGIFPVYRQDSISLRACTDPEGVETQKIPDIRQIISDFDIINVISHEFFSREIPNIFRTTVIKYNFFARYQSGGVYNDNRVDSLPAVSRQERDFSLYYLAQPDNRQSQALQDLRRLRVWDLYISETLTLQLPLRFATLVAGDIVTFRSDYVEHLYDTVDPLYKGRYCMVLSCDYSIDAQECIVTLGIPSPKMQRTTDTEQTDGGYNGWLPDTTYNNTQLFIWLSSDVDMNESLGNIVTWIDRQNSLSFSNQVGNNNNYNSGVGSPSKLLTDTNFYYARFRHADHEFLATTYNSKMDLSGTDGICVAMLLRASADPIGDTDFSGGTYYKAPLINCGRSYQMHLLDSFTGTTYINAIGYDNNSSTFHQNNQFSPPDTDWKIVIYSSADVGGYTGEDGLYVNGTRVNTSDIPPTNADISLSPNFRIGRDPDINYSNQTQQFDFAFGSFDLAELLTFSIPLHDAEREKVEGYIAHKYGLTSLLPATHPYKNTVPS